MSTNITKLKWSNQ